MKSTKPQGFSLKTSLSAQILLGMVLGVLAGSIFGASMSRWGDLGGLVIQLIKTIATPLLFFSIVHAVMKTDLEWRSGMRMVVVAFTNASVALAIGLGISQFFKPGRHLQLEGFLGTANTSATALTSAKAIDPWKAFAEYIPSNIIQPFLDNVLVTIVGMALVIGLGLRQVRRKEEFLSGFETIEKVIEVLLELTNVILCWIVKVTPIAVFGVVAKTVGVHGWAPLKGLAVYLAVGIAGLLTQILITYQIWIRACGIPLKKFWSEAWNPVVYSAGANSSLATLPFTLKALDRLGVSRKSSTLGACVGTNLNNDGILLYEAMAALLVAQAVGMDLTLQQQLLIVFASCVAALGIAGVPDAGIVSLSLVLATVGLPLEILPLLLTVDWIIARVRSVTNVVSDMVVSIALDRWDGNRYRYTHE